MKIAIFGATRGIGKEVVQQALAQGHEVLVLARNQADIAVQNERLSVRQGNVLDQTAVEQTLANVAAVICTLGKTSDNPDDLVSRGMANIISAMQETGVQRLIVVTSIGVGDSKSQAPLFFRLLMWTVLRKVMQEKERQEELVRQSGLQWTIVRPGGLTDGPQTGHYKHGLARSIKAGRISRADVAEFLLRQLAEKTYVRMAASVS